jgi:hypothetical protein
MEDFIAIRCTFWVNLQNGKLYLSEPVFDPHTEAQNAQFCRIKHVIRSDEKILQAVMEGQMDSIAGCIPRAVD